MSPGYFGPVVATHVVLNQTILTIQQLITQIQSSGSKGVVIRPQSEWDAMLFEGHTAGTTGPVTGGYALDAPEGPGRSKTWNVDTDLAHPPPSTASGIIFWLQCLLRSDNVATDYTLLNTVRNVNMYTVGNRFKQRTHVVQSAGLDEENELDWITIPLAIGARTIKHYVEWPNTGINLPQTFVDLRSIGYLT